MINNEKTKKVLGHSPYQLNNKYICFLPFRGEFGWYLVTHVKRVHGFNHTNKITCIKPGHECLFPTAQHFFYDWQDCLDEEKAGIVLNQDEDIIKEKIKQIYNTDDISFASSSEVSWEEKDSLANHVFIPQHKNNHNLKVDIAITPRKRKIDTLRNWGCNNWQLVVDHLVQQNITVGVCGTQDTSCSLKNVLYKSYDYIDIDSDVEMMHSAKLVVTQETGLQYLSFLCKRPTLCIGNYQGGDLHKDPHVFFKNVAAHPETLIKEITTYLESQK